MARLGRRRICVDGLPSEHVSQKTYREYDPTRAQAPLGDILIANKSGSDFAVAFLGSMSIVGVEKKQIVASRVGEKSLARFLCMAEENSVSEITEITHPVADSFQDFGLVVAAFNKAI